MGNILAQQNTVLPVNGRLERNTELFYCLTVITSLNKVVCQSVNAQHELSRLENYDKEKKDSKTIHDVKMRDIEVNNTKQSSLP